MSFRAWHQPGPALVGGTAALLLLTAGTPGLVSSAGAVEIGSFVAGEGGWHMGTLAVGNVTGDATPEIIVPYRNLSGQWFLDGYRPDGTRLPGFPYAGGTQEINTSPTLYDLDGDGRAEILFTCGANVVALRGDGTVLWSHSVNHANYVPDSGFMAVTNGFYWSDGGGYLSHLPATAVFSSQVASPIVADVNGDGSKEVVTAWKIDPDSTSNHQDFNPFINDLWGSGEWGTMGEVWSGGVVFQDALTGLRNYTYHFHQLVESGLALGQADADAPLETYVLNDSDSVVAFDKTRPHGLHGKGNLHGQFGKNQRLLSGSYQLGADVYARDIDGDGRAEVLVASTRSNPLWQPNETILDDDGTILWRAWKEAVTIPVNQWQNSSCLIPVNPDGDNHVDVLGFSHAHEITYRYWNGVNLVDHPGWPKSFAPFLPTPPVMGDVDGDGAEEIVIGTYNPSNPGTDGALYVFALDGSLEISEPVPGGLKHIPALADVTGDGGVEVIYRSLAGRVYIQNFGASAAGAVSWSTHRGNMQRDGNMGVSLFRPGTPVVTGRQSGYRRATFTWQTTTAPQFWRVYREERPEGPFLPLVTLGPGITSYTDHALRPGVQYLYEVAAVYEHETLRSAPFAILSGLGGNLLTNGGFEENGESHWDKWFTGELSWTNMTTTAATPHSGAAAMEITLSGHGSNGTVSQFSQYGTPEATLPVTAGKLYSLGGFFKSRGLSQSSEHWLEWSSAVTAANTNARPSRPWPYYFTPHFKPGTNATEWTYVNRTFVMPEGFANAEVGARYTVSAPATGSFLMDDLFFREIPSPEADAWTVLVPFGATWKYRSVLPSADWFSHGFDDSLWSSGPAKLGTGGGPQNVVTSLDPQKDAYFFRRTFIVPPERWEELLLSATCTRGPVGTALEIWLNGTPLVTSGIDAVTDQGNAVQYYDLTPFLPLLRTGENTIAVRLNNVWQSWDDVAFDVRLQAMSYTHDEAGFRAIEWLPDLITELLGVELDLTIPAGTIWRLESADSIADPEWQLMDVLPLGTLSPLLLRDIGQGGRVPPALAPQRFYRLRPY